MKTNILNLAPLAFVPAAMIGFTSCSSSAPDATETMSAVETADGAIIVDTYTATVTVTAIDAATRKVTFKLPDVHKSSYKCGPEVVNFAQIQVGHQVKATRTEERADE